jgi:hypothetical protein
MLTMWLSRRSSSTWMGRRPMGTPCGHGSVELCGFRGVRGKRVSHSRRISDVFMICVWTRDWPRERVSLSVHLLVAGVCASRLLITSTIEYRSLRSRLGRVVQFSTVWVSSVQFIIGLFPTGLFPTGLFPTGLFPTGLLPTGLLPMR